MKKIYWAGLCTFPFMVLALLVLSSNSYGVGDLGSSVLEELPSTTSESMPTTLENVAVTETPTPSAETPTPSAETPTPSAETPTPSAETPTPSAETPTPSAETPTPSAETPTPSAETPTPSAENKTGIIEESVSESSVFLDANAVFTQEAFFENNDSLSNWLEIDTIKGADKGNIQIIDGRLKITGTNVWGKTSLETLSQLDRSKGDINITSSLSTTTCTGSSQQMGYGDSSIVGKGTQAYILQKDGQVWNFRYFSGGVAQESVTLTQMPPCNPLEPVTLTLRVLKNGGAEVYLTDSQQLVGKLTKGTFTLKRAWFQNYASSISNFYDNIIISGPISLPGAPTGLRVSGSEGQFLLEWEKSFSGVTDYIVEYRGTHMSEWQIFNDGISTETSTTIANLFPGISYDFRVAAVNTVGNSVTSPTVNHVSIFSTPTAPQVVSAQIEGRFYVGDTLTAKYFYSDANGDTEGTSIIEWLKSDTLNGSYVSTGSFGKYYKIKSSDLNKYITYRVKPVSVSAPQNGTFFQASPSSQVRDMSKIYNHILSTGQSLSIGVGGAPALSTIQPYQNKFVFRNTLVPLVEVSVETMSSALANSLTVLEGSSKFQTIMSRNGVGSSAYRVLKKGTTPYINGINQIRAINALAKLSNIDHRVMAVTLTHGESDLLENTANNYLDYLIQWQKDYQTDIQTITKQAESVPMFLDQTSSHGGYGYTTSPIPLAQLAVSELFPDLFYLVTPKYFFTYVDIGHMNNKSYRHLGEYYAKVMKKVLIDKQPWKPLSPKSATINGDTITLKLHVPVPPLVLDTTLVSQKNNYGFEYFDESNSASITSVQILSSDTILIKLNTIPTGQNKRIRYAYTATKSVIPGAKNIGSAGGNVRDSDSAPSLYGNTLYNWLVHFDKPIE